MNLRSIFTAAAAALIIAVPVAGQTRFDDDPCRDQGRDDDYYRHCEVREESIAAGGSLKVKLAPGGGFVAEVRAK